ncbi:hypothetical protein ACWGCW_13820 [Streptomyces sp. NPDC054933]
MEHPPVVVHAPGPGGRRGTICGEPAGLATSLADVEEFLRRVGADPDEIGMDDPDLIEWQGGGSEVWAYEGQS